MRLRPLELSPWNAPAEGQQNRPIRPNSWNTPHGAAVPSEPRNLARVIELDVVPRLIQARHAASATYATEKDETRRLGRNVVRNLAQLLLSGDDALAQEFVEALVVGGATVESIYLDLLPAAARRLEELWNADSIHFIDVTLGVMRLQQIVRNYSEAFRREVPFHYHGHLVLLASMPEEQNGLGLTILSEFMYRAGWSVSGGPGLPVEEMRGLVSKGWFTLVGFFAECQGGMTALRARIEAVRNASCNRAVGVFVGGRVFAEHPEFVAQVGADTTAPDALQATVQAEGLLTLDRHEP